MADQHARQRVLNTLCCSSLGNCCLELCISQDFLKPLFSMKIALTLRDVESMHAIGLFLIVFLKYVKFRIVKMPIRKM